jgi:hypothetical protein
VKVFDDFSPKYYVDVKKDEMGGACCTHGERGNTRFWWGNLKERDHSECLEIDERVILKWILKK